MVILGKNNPGPPTGPPTGPPAGPPTGPPAGPPTGPPTGPPVAFPPNFTGKLQCDGATDDTFGCRIQAENFCSMAGPMQDTCENAVVMGTVAVDALGAHGYANVDLSHGQFSADFESDHLCETLSNIPGAPHCKDLQDFSIECNQGQCSATINGGAPVPVTSPALGQALAGMFTRPLMP